MSFCFAVEDALGFGDLVVLEDGTCFIVGAAVVGAAVVTTVLVVVDPAL